MEEVDAAQKYLQKSGLTLEKSVIKLKALASFLHEHRDETVKKAIIYAREQCTELEISIERRGRTKKKKIMPGEKAQDAGLTLEEETRRSMLECQDTFYTELIHRSKAMEDIASVFSALQPKILLYGTEEELRAVVPMLTSTFTELTDNSIILEIGRIRRHMVAAKINLKDAEIWTAFEFLSFIVKWDFSDSLPSLSLAMRIYLTICVSVASCERSFSKLKLIKTYLRSTMSQNRLTNLAILSIEKEHTKNIDFNDLIETFSAIKARKHL